MLYSEKIKNLRELLSINSRALAFCNGCSCFDLEKPYELIRLPEKPFTFNSVKKAITTPAPYRAILFMKSNRTWEKDLMAIRFYSSSAYFFYDRKEGAPYYDDKIDYFIRKIDFEEARKGNASPVFVLVQANELCQAAPAPDHKIKNYPDLLSERLRKVDDRHTARLDYNGMIVEAEEKKGYIIKNSFEMLAKNIVGPALVDKSGYISFYNVAERLRNAEILRQRRAAAAAAVLDTSEQENRIHTRIENARQVVADYVIAYAGIIPPYTAYDVVKMLFLAVSEYKLFQDRKARPDGFINIKAKIGALDDIEKYIQAVYVLISDHAAATA